MTHNSVYRFGRETLPTRTEATGGTLTLENTGGAEVDPATENTLSSIDTTVGGTLDVEQATPVGVEDSTGEQKDIANQEPIAHARLFNTSAFSSATDVLGGDVTPNNSPSHLRITVAPDSATTIQVAETANGNTVTYTLNDGNQVSAGNVATFDFPARGAGSYNIQLGSGVALRVLQVDEVQQGGV